MNHWKARLTCCTSRATRAFTEVRNMTTVRLAEGVEIQSFLRSLASARLTAIVAVFLLLTLVGVADYASGFSLSFSVFYLLPIILAGWRVGRAFACLIAVLSVFSLNAGDFLAGQRIQSGPLWAWNALIQFSFYLIVIWLLMRWKGLHETLEATVHERTRDLMAEIAAREEVESKLLTISEREQRRIGCDLHDVLCQQLAATALAAKVLQERSSGAAAVEAGNVVRMVEDGMTIAREMARGLTLVLSGNDNLSVALEELAARTQEHFKVECLLQIRGCPLPSGRFSSDTSLSHCARGHQQRRPSWESCAACHNAFAGRRSRHPYRAG